jgi:hypothetical protein
VPELKRGEQWILDRTHRRAVWKQKKLLYERNNKITKESRK